MATTRAELRRELDSLLQLASSGASVVRTVSSATQSTITDNSAAEPDDFWNDAWLYVPSMDEETRVVDFVSRTRTYYVLPALSSAPEAGTTYELRRHFSAKLINDVINQTIAEGAHHFPLEAEDESIIALPGKLDYELPSDMEELASVEIVWYPQSSGTATDGTTTSVTDTAQSWIENALVGQQIYFLTGANAGLTRAVAANTSTTISWSEALPVGVSAGTRYVVLDKTRPTSVQRVRHADVFGQTLHLRCFLPEGALLRVRYVARPQRLQTDSDTTSVPRTFVVLRTAQKLALLGLALLPDTMHPSLQSLHDRLETQVVQFLSSARRPVRRATWWNRGRGLLAGSWRIGTRESPQ